MAKEDKKGAEIAPLFPLADVKSVESVESVEETKQSEQWKVLTPFYDVIQKRVVQIGEIVEHNQRRVDYNLIDKA